MKVLGIDIGGTRIKAGVVDAAGQIVARATAETPTRMAEFRLTINRLVAELVAREGEPEGVGIGCKGIINPRTTKVEVLPGTFRFLVGTQLSALLEADWARHVPVVADNDARVAMAGEMVWGAAHGLANALLLTLGTGIGGAVVAEGRLLRGASGAAGHIGHLTIEADGAPCLCGNRGCLETVFSARAIEAEAMKAIHLGCETTLADPERGAMPDCRAVFEAAAAGDGVASLICDVAVEKLAAALAGLLHVLDPEVVIVGGEVSAAGEALFAPLRRAVAWRTGRLIKHPVPLVPPQVADRSGIVGAAALLMTLSK